MFALTYYSRNLTFVKRFTVASLPCILGHRKPVTKHPLSRKMATEGRHRETTPVQETSHRMRAIDEVSSLNATTFNAEVLPRDRPLVIRGLVDHWPLVAAARRSDRDFCTYLKGFDRGFEVNTAHGPPSIGGRLFYNDDLSGLNCRIEQARLSSSLDYLLEHAGDDPSPLLAIQSVIINRYLPGLEVENRLPAGIVPGDVDGRIWLGSRATIAAHFDPSENIACCIAGARRFTLFPPEQVANLYPGPFEFTPAGAIISMVDFDRPDFERFPRYRDAEAAALAAELHPGDAIYIPYLWWHHVRSLDAVNGLVNYWWTSVPARGSDPRNVLLFAMLVMRALPTPYREGWRSMFEHFVFGAGEDVGAHLPENRRGILGELGPEDVNRLKTALSQALSRN